MKSLLAIPKTVLALILSMVFLYSNIFAECNYEDRSDELEGPFSNISDAKLILGTVILVSALVVIFVPLPKAEVWVRDKDLFNKDGTHAWSFDATIQELKRCHCPVIVQQHASFDSISGSRAKPKLQYGGLGAIDKTHLMLQSQDDSIKLDLGQIHEIMDMPSYHKRKNAQNTKNFVLGVLIIGGILIGGGV